MKKSQKLAKIIQAIDNARELNLSGDNVKLFVNDQNKLNSMDLQELTGILRKLQEEESIIDIVQYPNVLASMAEVARLNFMLQREPFFIINVADSFDEWAQNHGIDLSGKYDSDEEPNVVYKVTYTTRREILINNFFLSKTHSFSVNDIVFDYLYKHPNLIFSRDEVKHILRDEPLNKTLHKIVENLGFKGELRQAFFDVTKETIYFRNPLTRPILDELGIRQLRLK